LQVRPFLGSTSAIICLFHVDHMRILILTVPEILAPFCNLLIDEVAYKVRGMTSPAGKGEECITLHSE